MKQESKIQYLVKENISEVPGVSTLKLGHRTKGGKSVKGGNPTAPENILGLKYCPGQFITVYFPETGTAEGKAYSISSAPSEEHLSITVRAIGQFSNRLCAMKLGDILTASEPYGYFYSESNDTTLVLFAAGIGIAPFRSMIVDSLEKYPARRILLFYSARMVSDLIFKKEFDNLSVSYRHVFSVKYFVTHQEDLSKKDVLKGMAKSRINVKEVMSAYGFRSEKLKVSAVSAEFFICGSISFVGDIWRGLKEAGVADEAIYTEAFFGH